MRRRIASLILSVLVAGCGEDEKQIKATLAAHERAFERLDFAAACALLTPAAQGQWYCNDDPDADNEPIATFEVKLPSITDIDVDGATAKVHRRSGLPTLMRKVDGEWRLDADEDVQQISETFDAAEAALSKSDFARFCALLTPAAQRAQVEDRIDPEAKTCADSFTPPPSEDGFQAVAGLIAWPPLRDVTVDGDVAEVHHASGEPTRMRRVGGRWLFD